MSPVERMDLWFLFLAYSAIFALLFAFMVKMLNKSRQLERDSERLARQWEAEAQADPAALGPVVPTVTPRRERPGI
ncbi:conserved protein of unknown function [Candidatus Hydrogenisulfobacillus filiaventi]|uniref:CcmD family protein n=1 Tax=Candidatus Hydrogenisulfobacillus filiaventi TaxID=2707344 RepID=A0A6F8ZH49_9FIRM|nr:CcmD family protein [Bacillota bacterium]CAB1128982.1 conserved protein of unknown function [Candidatus Hydrogenisulfobacillus filiaventi]